MSLWVQLLMGLKGKVERGLYIKMPAEIAGLRPAHRLFAGGAHNKKGRCGGRLQKGSASPTTVGDGSLLSQEEHREHDYSDIGEVILLLPPPSSH